MGWYRRSLFDVFSRYKGLTSGNNNINALRFQVNQSVGSSKYSLINGAMRKKMFYSIGKVVRYVPHIAVSGVVISNLLIELVRCEFSETVPYSKRQRVMIFDWDDEKDMTSPRFEKTKASFGNKILPPDHPTSIRVQRIGQNIVEAALKTHDENLKHLEVLEFIVVDKPIYNAYCCSPSKIVVFTRKLEDLKSDAEIAAVLGHEVGHAVARHVIEGSSDYVLFLLRTMFLPCLVMPRKLLGDTCKTLFKKLLPFGRRRELEADYIGMLLMASAGYDPRVCPLRFKRMVEIDCKWSTWLQSIYSTHPSDEKRAQFLSRPKVMKEAMCFYREAQLRQGISKASSSY